MFSVTNDKTIKYDIQRIPEVLHKVQKTELRTLKTIVAEIKSFGKPNQTFKTTLGKIKKTHYDLYVEYHSTINKRKMYVLHYDYEKIKERSSLFKDQYKDEWFSLERILPLTNKYYDGDFVKCLNTLSNNFDK